MLGTKRCGVCGSKKLSETEYNLYENGKKEIRENTVSQKLKDKFSKNKYKVIKEYKCEECGNIPIKLMDFAEADHIDFVWDQASRGSELGYQEYDKLKLKYPNIEELYRTREEHQKILDLEKSGKLTYKKMSKEETDRVMNELLNKKKGK